MFNSKNIHNEDQTSNTRSLLIAGAVLALSLGSATASAQQYVAEQILEQSLQQSEQQVSEKSDQKMDRDHDKAREEKAMDSNDQEQSAIPYRGTTDTII